jgi:CheY-like chemotaxis protein
MKILIADDDQLIRAMLADILGALGHTVVAARDGIEAVEMYGKEKPDVVFLDFLMPKLNGLDALARIRAAAAPAKAAVVLLTAISDRSVKALGAHEQPDAFLEKPLKPRAVEKALAKVAPAP